MWVNINNGYIVFSGLVQERLFVYLHWISIHQSNNFLIYTFEKDSYETRSGSSGCWKDLDLKVLPNNQEL